MIQDAELSEGDWIEGKVWFKSKFSRVLCYVTKINDVWRYCYGQVMSTLDNDGNVITLLDGRTNSIMCHYESFDLSDIRLTYENLASLINLALITNDKTWFLSLTEAARKMKVKGMSQLTFSNKKFIEVVD